MKIEDDLSIEASDLDELVQEMCMTLASLINNGGKKEQMRFLRKHGLTDAEVRASVHGGQ